MSHAKDRAVRAAASPGLAGAFILLALGLAGTATAGADPGHLQRAQAAEGRIVLAGRLGPDNVRQAVERVRPWAVDAASRLEAEPGVKDHAKVRAFVRAARC